MPRGVYIRTEECNRKNSESKIGGTYIRNEEHCRQISERNKNRVYTEEIRKNISKAQKGRKHSEETKNKMSESKIGNKNGLKEKPIDPNTYHERMTNEIEIRNCFLCNITNDEHKKIYKRRLDLHCRDGNYNNIDSDNWIVVCTKCHNKIDRLDFRGRNGIKGYIGEKGDINEHTTI